MQRQIHELHKTISVNEEEALKLKSDLEWANTRIHKLEHALNQATSVVKRHQDASEQLEFKVGDYQEQIRDMEKFVVLADCEKMLLMRSFSQDSAFIDISASLTETGTGTEGRASVAGLGTASGGGTRVRVGYLCYFRERAKFGS